MKQRKELLAELYISTDDKLYYLTYFVSADQFFNLMKGKDENQVLIEERINKLAKIDRILELINKRNALYESEIADLKSQKQELGQKLVLLAMEIQTKQNLLETTDLKAFNLQNYLISLKKMNALLERDFVGWNVAEGDDFVFIGGGTEHGIGMSQHGAAGLARLGKNYKEILEYYYQNTKVKAKSDPNGRIKVWLRSASPSGGKICPKDENSSILVGEKKVKGCVSVSPSTVPKVPKKIIIAPIAPNSTLLVKYKNSSYNEYTGKIIVNNISGQLFTINDVKIETYLKGVVPSEMPHSWPLEALKAQAVAARSYAVKHISAGSLFDIDDTTRNQVYLGKLHEFEETNKAVQATAGEVVVYGAEIIPTYYHSTSGGYTENNENVWGGRPRPYLRGVPSPWEENSPWWLWGTKTFSRQELSDILAKNEATKVGFLQKIEILNRGISGRVIAIKLTGSEREVVVTGQTLRQTINNNQGESNPLFRSILFGVR